MRESAMSTNRDKSDNLFRKEVIELRVSDHLVHSARTRASRGRRNPFGLLEDIVVVHLRGNVICEFAFQHPSTDRVLARIERHQEAIGDPKSWGQEYGVGLNRLSVN
jgi:hypothetical protein